MFVTFNIFGLLLLSSYIKAGAVIERLEMCDPEKDYAITFKSKFKMENGIQFLDGSLDSRVDFNDDIMSSVNLYILQNDKWNFIINKTDNVCKLIKNFAGDFATEMEQAAGITNGCPYAKGSYKVSNYPLDFKKFKYKDFPEGRLKIKSEYIDVNTKELLSCFEFEFTLKK